MAIENPDQRTGVQIVRRVIEAVVFDKPQKESNMPMMPPGGMGGMDGMY